MSEATSKNPHLDLISQRFIERLKALETKPLYELSPEEARAFLANLQKEDYKYLEAEVRDLELETEEAGAVSVRLVRPSDKKEELLPLIVYSHGGGWVMGDSEVYDMTIRKLAKKSKSAVAFINYSRSPEAKYPKAINQIYAALKYFAINGAKYNIDTEHIAIAGDSAGGNMATAVAIKAIKENGPNICFQALIYPVTDAEMKTESYKEFRDGPWLTQKAMEYFWNAYLPDKSYKDEIMVSPLKAELEDLEGLPPTLIITDENDVLRDEGEAYARKLIEAGVDTVSIRINNLHHDFIMLNSLRESKAVKTAFKILAKSLKHALHKED